MRCAAAWRATRCPRRSSCYLPCPALRPASLSWPASAASPPTPSPHRRAGRGSKPRCALVLEAQAGPAGDLDARVLVIGVWAPLVELHDAGRQQFEAVEELRDLRPRPVGLRGGQRVVFLARASAAASASTSLAGCEMAR